MRLQWGFVVATAATLTGALAGGLVATTVASPPPATVAVPALAVAAELHREVAPVTPTAMTAVDGAPQGPESPRGTEPVQTEPAVASATPGTGADGAAVRVAACPTVTTGSTGDAPSAVSPAGVAGTSTDDLAAFARAYNAVRVANCLPPVPPANFRYDACMEARLFWMAEDPSTDPASAWGHVGSVRSDGLASVGCDGNLAGGMNNTGETFARKWWESAAHRTSLYKPGYTGSTASVCIYLAVTHGGVPDEPVAFARAAARWASC